MAALDRPDRNIFRVMIISPVRPGSRSLGETSQIGHFEESFKRGLLFAGPDDVGRRLCPKEEVQRSDQYGFACTGLSRENVEALCELHFHVIYDSQLEIFR